MLTAAPPAFAKAAVPAKVSGVSVASAHGRVQVRWVVPASGQSSAAYEVQYRQSGSADWQLASADSGSAALTVSGLRDGKKHWFQVRATDGGLAGPWSTAVSAVPRVSPTEPTALKVKPSPLNAEDEEVSWDPPTELDGADTGAYEVSYRVSGSSSWKPVAGAHSDRNALLGPLAPETKYWVRVRAFVDSDGAAWAQKSFTLRTALQAPTGLATGGSKTALRVTWSAVTPSSGVVSAYDTRYRMVGANSWTAGPTVAGAANAADVSDLVEGVDYEIAVRGRDSAGPGRWSASRVQRVGTVPAQAASVEVTMGEAASDVRLRWVPPNSSAGPITGYEAVYWRADGTRGTPITLPPSATTLNVSNLVAGHRYLFQVRAINGAGRGAYSVPVGGVRPHLTLPIMRLTTQNAAPIVDTDTYVGGQAAIAPNGNAVDSFQGALTVKGHGNSTWGKPKKAYRLKFDKSLPVLGMPKSKNWVLLANFSDRTQMRNAVALQLGSKTRLGWTPRVRYVELILNNRYLGVYQVAEHVRIGAGRLEIDEMTEADSQGSSLTGGYLLERDARLEQNNEPGFRTVKQQPFVVKSPEPVSTGQMDYIRSYVKQSEAALFSSSFGDSSSGYANYFDVDSFIDWYLVEELVRNQDAWYSSAYLYKPRNGKLFMGPLWDFDLSMGTTAASAPSPPTGWWVRETSPWFKRLFADPAFEAKVRARWRELRPSVAALNQFIDGSAAQIRTAAGDDNALWRGTAAPGAFDADVAELHTWLNTRASWIDAQYSTSSD